MPDAASECLPCYTHIDIGEGREKNRLVLDTCYAMGPIYPHFAKVCFSSVFIVQILGS